jgi:cationic amino acid transporter 3
MFPLPRVLYAIASDGLIFRTLSKLSSKFRTPLLATILSGLFAGIMAMIFDLDELVNMMSIGTLLAYSLVAISVLILRYQIDIFENSNEHISLNQDSVQEHNEELGSLFQQLINSKSITEPTSNTSRLVSILTTICACIIVVICVILAVGANNLTDWFVLAPIGVLVLIGIIIGIFINKQPQNQKAITFQMPFVPFLPLLSVFINFYLMSILNSATWIRFAVWMALGFVIYFVYGITNSSETNEYQRLARSASNSSINSTASKQSILSNRSNTRNFNTINSD